MKTDIQKTTATDTYSVDPRNIIVTEGFNVRIDYGDIDGLAQSIQESGLKVPVRAYRSKEDNTKFVLVDGHRRLRACMMLIKKGIEIKMPLVLEGRAYSEEERTLDMWRTNDGKALTPIEKAEIVKRMLDYGWDEKTIASKVGVSITAIYNMLEIANAPTKVKNMIASNEVSSTFALKVLRETKDTTKVIEKLTAALTSGSLGGSEKKKKTITAKSLSSSENKVNSISEFRKFDKSCKKDGSVIIRSMIDTYDIIEKMLEGKLTRKNFEKLFIHKNPK